MIFRCCIIRFSGRLISLRFVQMILFCGLLIRAKCGSLVFGFGLSLCGTHLYCWISKSAPVLLPIERERERVVASFFSFSSSCVWEREATLAISGGDAAAIPGGDTAAIPGGDATASPVISSALSPVSFSFFSSASFPFRALDLWCLLLASGGQIMWFAV